ncbi:MAG: hypothetical protein CVU56_05100 [Deltaproteobacteria bacterium HGW-Deltaproteobacteria-14]|jgi:opacity protein-like surface antigen|nr:MAG: hypothetical protein CVU56_05100 [Deltaproteobacteria bacterium HGW-Deltaproteobacteria-14]
MRRPLLAALAIALLLPTAPAGAAESDELIGLLRNDLTAIGVNMPVWMSQHITAVMPSTGLGAGSGLSDDSGAFTFGVMTRLGLLNNFKDVGYGLELVDLEGPLPNLMPWPQLGVVFGFGLGDGLELGADVQFIPNLDIAGDGINLKAGLFSIGATLRWRVTKADGALPALVLGLGASYYRGSFEVGVGYERPYSETLDGHTATGTYRLDSAPAVNWSLFQANPEVRLAWDIGGVLRPYVGIGVGFAGGSVSNEVNVKAHLTIDTIDGAPANQDPITYSENVVSFSTTPALYTLRPHIGLDLVLGVVAITLQADFAVMGKDKLNTDFSSAAGSFDTSDPNFLFNQNQRGSQSDGAVVVTAAVRAQF